MQFQLFANFKNLILLVLCGIYLAGSSGCGRTINNKATNKTDPKAEKAEENSLDLARELVRHGSDVGKCKEVIRLLNSYLLKNPAEKSKIAGFEVNPTFLRDVCHVSPTELGALASSNYSHADAYHMQWHLQLRDLVDAMRWLELSKQERARQAFSWTMREVVLDSSYDVLLPPSIALLQGKGSSQERILVFLDLLQHLDLAGCVIAFPGKKGEKKYWLAGVILPEGKGENIFLFDPLLGLPVPGPDGKGIATLDQLRKNPDLLKQLSVGKDYAYNVTPEQARDSEVFLAFSLESISPRMGYLESRINQGDLIHLAMNPVKTYEYFKKIAGDKVYVWNSEVPAQSPLQISPLRALRMFLIPEEGGVGSPNRYQGFSRPHVAIADVFEQLQRLQLYEALPSQLARDQLAQITMSVLDKFLVRPREKLLHGRFQEMITPLVKIRAVVDEHYRAPLHGDQLLKEIGKWRENLQQAYLEMAQGNPQGENKVRRLWAEDQYLLELIVPGTEDDELPREERTKKKMLTFIILEATGPLIERESLYLLALAWLEQAHRSQSQINDLLAQKKQPPAKLLERARNDWNNAIDKANQYVSRYSIQPRDMHSRLQRLGNQNWSQPTIPIDQYNELFLSVHRNAGMHLELVEALSTTGNKKKAIEQLDLLSNNLKSFRSNSELKNHMVNLATQVGRSPLGSAFQERLNSLYGTTQRDGSLYWMEYSAQLRMAQLTRKIH